MKIRMQPRWGVMIRQPGDDEPALVKGTASFSKEIVCTKYDEIRFSTPPEVRVYLGRVDEFEIVDSSDGLLVEAINFNHEED